MLSVVMAALRSRWGHYIFILWFLSEWVTVSSLSDTNVNELNKLVNERRVQFLRIRFNKISRTFSQTICSECFKLHQKPNSPCIADRHSSFPHLTSALSSSSSRLEMLHFDCDWEGIQAEKKMLIEEQMILFHSTLQLFCIFGPTQIHCA